MGISLINSKKGVSPLIATVLLIAFAVALGAVVMNWGRAQLDPHGSQGICSNVEISLEKIDNQLNLCYSSDDSKISFLLRNDGSTSVHKMRMTLISSSVDPYNNVINQRIDPAETKRYEISYSPNFGNIQKIRLTPIIVADLNNPLSEQVCMDKAIEILQPVPC